MAPRRGTGRDCCAAHCSVFESDIDFNGRIAPAVENLAGMDIDNGGHFGAPFSGRAHFNGFLRAVDRTLE